MGSLGKIRLLWLAGAVGVLAVSAIPAHAQDADDQQRGVARISLINGEVSVKRGDAAEWVAGVVNAPLLSDEGKDATGEVASKPTLATSTSPQQPIRLQQQAVNATPQTARAAGWEDTAKRWP